MGIEVDMEELPEVETPAVNLSSEQRAVLEMVHNGRSVFFTGSAGKFILVNIEWSINNQRVQERASLSFFAKSLNYVAMAKVHGIRHLQSQRRPVLHQSISEDALCILGQVLGWARSLSSNWRAEFWGKR